jgi:pimeloyl-ACP methyl ester carboxylesterase
VAAAYQDRFFTTPEGLRLHYLDWGGDSPPMLFIHPTGFHAHVWDSYAAQFRSRFRCIAVDTRGHGDSDRPGVYSWDAMAGDIEALADALDLRGITGIGHSGGGTAIGVLAAHRPERMRRAILIDPILIYLDLRRAGVSENRLEIASRKRRMDWPSRAAMIESYGSRPPFNAWQPDNLANYVNFGVYDQPDGTVRLKMPGEHEAEVFRQAAHGLDPEVILRGIRCPTLLIAGAESEAFPPARAERAVSLLAHGELLSVAGEGHFAPFTRTPEVIAAIDRFIAATEHGAAK